VRLAVYLSGMKLTGEFPPAVEEYIGYFIIGLMSLFLTPLYCVWIFDNCHLFHNAAFVLRVKSRLRLTLEYLKFTAVDALSFVIVLNLTALPLVAAKTGGVYAYFAFFALSMLSQFLFFSVCSALFFLIFLMTGRSAVSFIAVVLYGAADYGGGVPIPFYRWISIGTARTFLPDISGYLTSRIPDFTSMLFLAVFFTVLSAACALACSRRDFIGRNEGNNDE
jgi:hypothetical protein